jgi:hypothetical protein
VLRTGRILTLPGCIGGSSAGGDSPCDVSADGGDPCGATGSAPPGPNGPNSVYDPFAFATVSADNSDNSTDPDPNYGPPCAAGLGQCAQVTTQIITNPYEMLSLLDLEPGDPDYAMAVLGLTYEMTAPTMAYISDAFLVEMSFMPGILGVEGTIADAGTDTLGTVVNLGGEGEVPGAINVQGPWILDSNWVSSATGQSLGDLQAAGNQFVIVDNTALPFADNSVDTVITNNVPIDTDTWLGPSAQSSEINRILAPGGTWINNGVVVSPGP